MEQNARRHSMRSWCSFLLEDLQFRKPFAHLLLSVGRGHPTRQESAKLREEPA